MIENTTEYLNIFISLVIPDYYRRYEKVHINCLHFIILVRLRSSFLEFYLVL